MMIVLFLMSYMFANDVSSMTIGDVAVNIQQSFPPIIQLLVATSYVSGLGFGIAAIFKFKQVKDNPTQIPVSTPFALLGTSAMLVFLPALFAPVGVTLFGDDLQSGTPSGSTVIANLTSS